MTTGKMTCGAGGLSAGVTCAAWGSTASPARYRHGASSISPDNVKELSAISYQLLKAESLQLNILQTVVLSFHKAVRAL
jgi:hypothetical protein